MHTTQAEVKTESTSEPCGKDTQLTTSLSRFQPNVMYVSIMEMLHLSRWCLKRSSSYNHAYLFCLFVDYV